MPLPEILFIVGPTATGKTEVAFDLAQRLHGEIISCDSMQLYKELSILSAKPPQKMMAQVSHHLIGTVSISRNFDVALYRREALAAIQAVLQKGKLPIVVGGSGLYMGILLDGIFEGKGGSLSVRKKLEKEAQQKGLPVLYETLKKVDPVSAKKIHPHDKKRIIRALEVFLIHERPISQLQKKRSGLWNQYDVQVIALTRPREELYERINQRVDAMFEAGAVEEIKALMKKRWGKTAKTLIGVPEIQKFIKGGQDLDQTKYLVKLNTRHLAKRQLTWFRKDKRLKWVEIARDQSDRDITKKILNELGG